MSAPHIRPAQQAAIPFALVVMLALIAGLIYNARAAERSHRATAERALHDYAGFAAWEFARYAENLLADKTASAVHRARVLDLAAGDPLPPASLLLPTPGSCGCGFGEDLRWSFRVDLGAGTVSTSGPVTEAARRSLGRRGALWRQAVAEGVGTRHEPDADARAGEPPRGYRLTVDTLGGEAVAFAYTVVRDRAGTPRAVYGAVAAIEAVTRTFECTMKDRPLLPPSLVGGAPNDSVLRVRIAAASGPLFLRLGVSDAPGAPVYAASDTGRPWLGGLVTTVELRSAVASRLVIGGVPGSRLPMLLALLAVAALLAAVAMVQLRRGVELSRMRGRFVANVSHELRTPLAQISMFSETLLLERERSPAERQHFLSVIYREAGRLTSLVENVLRFSRADAGAGFAGAARLAPEPRDVADDVRDALNAFVPLARATGAAIDPELDDDAIALADAGAVRQVVLNLLDNAVKYGPREQTVAVRVARQAGGLVVVSVADQGEGIPAAERERAFQPFVRLERAGQPKVSGTGIGLAVVRELVGAMGGRVWIEDVYPDRPASRGTRVSFTLPAAAMATARTAYGIQQFGGRDVPAVAGGVPVRETP